MLPISNQFGKGGTGQGDLKAILTELQGLRLSLVDGAEDGDKMPINDMRPEDTIVAAIHNTAGALVQLNDVSIYDTHAVGTLTFTDVPTAGDTVVVGEHEYTFIAASATRVKGTKTVNIGTVGEEDTGDNLAAVINEVENWDGEAAVVATSDGAGVVTIRAVADAEAGNTIVLTEDADNCTVSGSGTLEGGDSEGGVVSQTDIDGDQLLVLWFDRVPTVNEG